METKIPRWSNPHSAAKDARLFQEGYRWAYSPCGTAPPERSDLSPSDELLVHQGFFAAKKAIALKESAKVAATPAKSEP